MKGSSHDTMKPINKSSEHIGSLTFWIISLIILLTAVSFNFQEVNPAQTEDERGLGSEVDRHDCLTGLQTNIYLPHNLSSPYWDATGQVGEGLLQGNLVWLGRYDECQQLKDGLYCLADIQAKVTSLPFKHTNASLLRILWGICAVKACNCSIIESNINNIFQDTLGLEGFEVEHSNVNCSYLSGRNKSFYVVIGMLAVLLLFGALGSVVDLRHEYLVCHHPRLVHRIDGAGAHLVSATSISDTQNGSDDSPSWERPPSSEHLIRALRINEGPLVRFCRCFSAVRHVRELFEVPSKTTSRLAYLDGIRVLSILWIMLGHTYLGAFASGLIDNPKDAYQLPQQGSWQFVGNAYFAVDTFFLLSGLLVSYLSLPVLRAQDGKLPIAKFYLYRYVRLTPVVGVTMLLWMFVLPHLGSGPLWYQMQGDQTCPRYWWSNLLYIQNFYPTSLQDVCIGWVWYLALDMQFYLISPAVLLILYRGLKQGVVMTTVVVLSSLVVTAALIGYYNIEINLTLSVLQGNVKAVDDYESIIYGKPYCRIVPYLVGMLLGYLLHIENNEKRRLPKPVVVLGWLSSLCLMVALVWGLYWSFQGHSLTVAENVLYGSVSHLVWALALAWLIYASQHGYAGVAGDFLSWSWWGPLSQLTYAVYMFHPLLMFTFNLSQKATFYMDPLFMAMRYWGFVVLSFLGAFILHIVVELPFVKLLKLCSSSPRSNN